MGHNEHPQFGNLYKIYNIAYYRLSPYELKAFKGFFSQGIRNQMRLLQRYGLLVAVPLGLHYCVYSWAKEEYVKINRKNPDDFKDDV